MTAPIILPETQGARTDRPRMIDFGGQLRPSLGGPVQTLFRLGTRHAIDITLPTMRAEPAGRIWSAQLRLAKLYGALIWLRQDGLNIGTPGTGVAVNGADQTGTTLNLKGFTASYAIKQGQAFSIITGGKRYLYFAAADTTCDGSGNVSLPIFPMLRKPPANNDVAEFAKPYVQGSLSGNEVSWERLPGGYFNFGTITITEDE